jgi:hypothetical protein
MPRGNELKPSASGQVTKSEPHCFSVETRLAASPASKHEIFR